MSEVKIGSLGIVGIVAIVAIAGLLMLAKGMADNTGITGMAVAGQGRVKGQCMKDCMAEFGQDGEEFDKNSDLVMYCHGQCPSAAVDNSACEVHADNCCVPFSGDPDCSGAAGSGGVACPCFTAAEAQQWVSWTGVPFVLTINSPPYEVRGDAQNLGVIPNRITGLNSWWDGFHPAHCQIEVYTWDPNTQTKVPYVSTHLEDLTVEENDACQAIILGLA